MSLNLTIHKPTSFGISNIERWWWEDNVRIFNRSSRDMGCAEAEVVVGNEESYGEGLCV
jgi:hypothetical protein